MHIYLSTGCLVRFVYVACDAAPRFPTSAGCPAIRSDAYGEGLNQFKDGVSGFGRQLLVRRVTHARAS